MSFSTPGRDGIWFTADDAGAGRAYHYDNAGNETGVATLSGPGPDGLWATADDQITGCDALVPTTHDVVYFAAPGPDQRWCTADDTVSSYVHDDYFAKDLTSVSSLYRDAGADHVWFTADDVLSERGTIDRDALGNQTSSVFSSPGPDGIWGTSDDLIGTRTVFNSSF